MAASYEGGGQFSALPPYLQPSRSPGDSLELSGLEALEVELSHE